MGLVTVRDGELGLYLWRLPDGRYFQDGEGNFLSIPAQYGDLRRMADISKAARHYGAPAGGRAVFISNARQISDSEHDDQMERMLDGRLPDPFDVGALKDEINGKR